MTVEQLADNVDTVVNETSEAQADEDSQRDSGPETREPPPETPEPGSITIEW
jgi:hypothetical protein